MFKKKAVLGVVAACGFLISGVSFASVNPIIATNSQVGISFVDTQSNYSEDIKSPSGADVENGMLPGFKLQASDNFNLFGIHNWYASTSYRHDSGQVQYAEGSSFTSSTHVGNMIRAKLGKTFFLNSDMAVTPYVFGGYRWWDRTVPNGVAAPEYYSNGYVGLGGMFQIAATKRLVLSANAGYGEVIGAGVTGMVNPQLTELYHGLPSKVSFNLASRPYYTFGLGANYRINKRLHLFVNADYTDFMYGGSQVNAYPVTTWWGAHGVDTLREPSSQTSQMSVGIGLGYSFA